MSDKDHFIKLVEAILSTSNEERNAAVSQLNNASKANPDQFVLVTLDIIKDQNLNSSIRSSAIILLKKKLVINPTTQESIYYALSKELQEHFRRDILIILSTLGEKKLVDQVSDLIADVAGSILNDSSVAGTDEEKWPNLVQHLFELFGTKSELAMSSVLTIFEGLFLVVSHKLVKYNSEFYQLFDAGLVCEQISVRVSALESVCTLIESSKAKDMKPFKELRDKMLKVISDLVQVGDEDNLQVAISRIFDLCEGEPAFLKTKFDELFIVMNAVRSAIVDRDNNLKIEAVESLIFLLERYPDLVKDNTERLQKVVEMVFLLMMDIEDDVEDDWKSPPDGFNDDLEEDDDQKFIKLGMDYIDRLITHIGKEFMLKFLSQIVNKMLVDTNWKMKHAAIMAISQIGEYMLDNFNEVGPIIKILMDNINDPNPRIRYACCHCIGQFADDLSPEFQNKFHNEFFQIVVPRLDDPVPRVVAHALAALTNFLESSSNDQIKPFFTVLCEKILSWLMNGIVYVREACLSALSALCEGAPDLFKVVLEQVMVTVFGVLQSVDKDEHSELKGNAIECATIIAKVYGDQTFAPYTQKLIEEMVKIQDYSVNQDGADPQKSYIIAGWQRLCLTIGDKLAPYIDNIIPNLLKLAAEPIRNSANATDAKTTDYERAEIAVQMINVFMESMGNSLGKYIEEIYNYVCLVTGSFLNDDIKLSALGLLPGIVKIHKITNADTSPQFSKNVMLKIWTLIDVENDPLSISEMLYFMQKVLKNAGKIFNQDELMQIVAKCEEHIKKSESRKEEILDAYDTEEETVEDLELVVNADKESEDDLKLEIANVFGILFDTHRQDSLAMFQHIYQNHISMSFNNDQHIKAIHYGIFLVDDSLEYLGEFLGENTVVTFLEILLKYSLHEKLEIRQSAIFGVGLIAQLLKENFKTYFDQVTDVVTKAVNIPKGENDMNRGYMACKENAVSTFGKILFSMWSSLDQEKLQNMVNYWIQHLPIVHDYKEALIQHQLLMQTLVSNYNVILGNNMVNLGRLVKIFATIYKKKKVSNQQINDSIEEIVRAFLNNEQIKTNLNGLQLEEAEQKFLQLFL